MDKDQLSTIIGRILDESLWSPRFPVNRSERIERLAHPRHDPLPKQGGIYRIHLEGVPTLAFVGSTQDIRRRINELSGIRKDVMPFTDPHAASPSLWAWSQIYPAHPYTVSFAPMPVSDEYWRQGIETLVIAYARWRQKCSPLANFRKMPSGWVSSSSREKGYRGGKTPYANASHTPSIVPVGNLDDPRDPIDPNWGGYPWSAWCDPREIAPLHQIQGLYRLRKKGDSQLLSIGHGGIQDAVSNAAAQTDTDFSYVEGIWNSSEMQELLVDLLGLYLCGTHSLPTAQYGGEDLQQTSGDLPIRPITTQMLLFFRRLVPQGQGLSHQSIPQIA